MTTTYVSITPKDAVIARDGRPFGMQQGYRMRSLKWPTPSMTAGAIRSALVNSTAELTFAGDMPDRLLNIEVAGAFPCSDEELYFPAPVDCIRNELLDRIVSTRPYDLPPGAGCDFPHSLSKTPSPLRPVIYSDSTEVKDFKPAPIPSWWPASKYAEWLLDSTVTRSSQWFHDGFLQNPVMEHRDHVKINPSDGSAEEGNLFSTTGLHLSLLPKFKTDRNIKEGTAEFTQQTWSELYKHVSLSVRIRVDSSETDFDHVTKLRAWGTMGGERRLAHLVSENQSQAWLCPPSLVSALKASSKIRMVLATPAIFQHGWLPGWLDPNSFEGKPFDDSPTLRLVGVTNQRWNAISGWALAKVRGPKPIRRMVPAGSVYFFEKVDQEASGSFSNHWLQSVCDHKQDRSDGFGLALWGCWNN